MAPPPYRFTSYDLDSCIEVPRMLQDRAGGLASADALALYLGYKGANNGAFLTRLANARLFGLVEGPAGELRPSKRALNILQPDYPNTAARARLEAFESVPLYKEFLLAYHGQTLPDDTGMKNALETRWKVNPEKSAFVLSRLLDSAEQAGLFDIAGNRSKMIRPTFVDVADHDVPAREDPIIDERVAKANGDLHPPKATGVRANKIIDGVLEMLPAEQRWDEASLSHWLRFFEDALRLYYKLPRRSSGSSNAAVSAGSMEGGGR